MARIFTRRTALAGVLALPLLLVTLSAAQAQTEKMFICKKCGRKLGAALPESCPNCGQRFGGGNSISWEETDPNAAEREAALKRRSGDISWPAVIIAVVAALLLAILVPLMIRNRRRKALQPDDDDQGHRRPRKRKVSGTARPRKSEPL